VAKYNKSHEFQVRGVRPGVLDLFQRYPWPGNVRELEHAIEGAMSIMDGEFIEIHDLPPPLLVFSMKPAGAMDNPKKPLHESLRELERGILQETLRRCQGNISRAARALGVPRQTLQSKIKRLGM
jgi:arginine utilization regulatory protein